MILDPDDYEQMAALMPISELPEGDGFGIDVGTVSPVVVPSAQVVEPPGLQPGGPGRRRAATTIEERDE